MGSERRGSSYAYIWRREYTFSSFDETYRSSSKNDEANLKQCKAIFDAAAEVYKGGYLFNARALVQAEIFDDALEQASELLQSNYKDPACVVAGVALETTLKELCTRNNLPHSKLNQMNSDLCKAGVYNTAMQQQITAWAERRNKAAHGDGTVSKVTDIKTMIDGVRQFIAEYL